MKKSRYFTKEEWSWILYESAGSAYAVIMNGVLFPVYFSIATGRDGDIRWGFLSSVTAILMAFLAPLTGSLGDVRGRKKRLFVVYTVVGLIGTALTVLGRYPALVMAAYAVSTIGASGSGMVYDAFLTDVTRHERLDLISSWGYAVGYLGGRVLPLSAGILLLLYMPGEQQAIRWSVLLTVAWWTFLSIPFLGRVRQRHYSQPTGEKIFQEAWRKTYRTAAAIVGNRKLRVFLLAYFLYMDGVGTIVRMSAAYGADLDLDTVGMTVIFLLTQLIAVPSALAAGRLSRRIGSIPTILTGVGIYILAAILCFFMGAGIEYAFLQKNTALLLFGGVAVLSGMSQGGLMAISRSAFVKLLPRDRANEYFGFFHMSGRMAAVLGPALYALLKLLTGYGSIGVLGTVPLLLAGGCILYRFRRIFPG